MAEVFSVDSDVQGDCFGIPDKLWPDIRDSRLPSGLPHGRALRIEGKRREQDEGGDGEAGVVVEPPHFLARAHTALREDVAEHEGEVGNHGARKPCARTSTMCIYRNER